MRSFVVVRINFSLTDRAASEINRLTSYVSEKEAKAMVASLLWSEAYEEAERQLVSNGFVLGWYELGKVPAEAVQEVDGTRLIFPVTERQAMNFEGKTIDFIDDNFRFVEGEIS